MLDIKVEDIAKGAKNACEVLKGESQALWSVLRLSLAQQLDYWLQLCYPSDILHAAQKMDSVMWGVLEQIVGSHIPRKSEGHSWECVLDVPVANLNGRSFQE